MPYTALVWRRAVKLPDFFCMLKPKHVLQEGWGTDGQSVLDTTRHLAFKELHIIYGIYQVREYDSISAVFS